MTRSWWVAGCIVVAACSGNGDSEVVVFAAASLSDAFAAVEAEFEAMNPDVEVQINFAGSSTLAAQLLEGAPADVFASADLQAMGSVLSEGLVMSPSVFATNEMIIAVPEGNPAGVAGLADLEDDRLFVGVCAGPVPCGRAARQVFTKAGIVPSIDTEEPDVRSLLTKIEAGELDAGIVYVSDVQDRSRVEAIPIDGSVNVTVSYPIAAAETAGRAAQDFVAFVLSQSGQAILAEFGFGR